MSKNKRYSIILGLVSLTLVVVWSTGLLSSSQRDYYATVSRNIKIFGEVYKETAKNYVEEIDPEKFMRAGINGMMDNIDPYSVFLEKDAQEDIEIMTRGKYYGVGMRISKRNGWPTVAEQPFANSPAEKAGIREGDQIIEINKESTKGLSLSQTAAKLRGKKKGSTVEIKIKRIGIDEPVAFSLVRDEIIVSDIQFSGFVEPGIGLIKLNVFNRGAEKQVHDAIEELLDQGVESLILDLRGNPGGLLDVAVSVLGNFVSRGEMVVYTKGRNPNSSKEYRTSASPVFGSLPLVVLVNEYSASASEIVAGAIQDLDRGVVIGEPTFGKGLVQTVLPIDRSADGEVSLKLTTAKYYLPSGRLIQKEDVFKHGPHSVLWSPESKDVETDSSAVYEKDQSKYFTHNGRRVNGGGGIKPDIETSNSKTTRFVGELMRQSIFFNFSLQYASSHSDFTVDSEITEDILDNFFKFVDEQEFDFEPFGTSQLESLEKASREGEFYEDMAPYFEQIRQKFGVVKDREREKSLPDVKYLLKRELVAKLAGNDSAYTTSFERDATLKKAVSVLKDKDEYNRLLGVQTASSK